VLKLLAFTLPLCLDTFAVSFAVLGGMHLTRPQRIRVIALLVAFEAGMPLVGMAVAAPLMHLVSSPTHLVVDPYQLGSPAEAKQLRLAYGAHLADTTDLTFVGRYLLPIVVPVVVGGLGLLMLDESLNDDDDDDDDDDGDDDDGDDDAADVIIAIVIQAFLAILLGQLLGRKARAGQLRLSAERLTSGSKLLAGGVLVTLSAALLIGPPVATHLLPHFIHHRPPHSSAPQAVSTVDPP
jgi:putative Mn2+ efflux pump MntP